MADISGLGNPHWDSHWPNEGLQYDSKGGLYDDQQILDFQMSVLKNWTNNADKNHVHGWYYNIDCLMTDI